MNRHTDTLSCSVGIFCHNEAGNIASLVRALQTQHLRECAIDEIIVVSSASTDGTDDLVRDAMRTEPRLKLITQANARQILRHQSVFWIKRKMISL
jgi:glycosyltransferase involved in cell wall biosynthesis